MTHSNTLPNVDRPKSSMHAYFSCSNHAHIDEESLTCTSPTKTPQARSRYKVTLSHNTVSSSRDTAATQNDISSASIIDTKTRCSFTVQLFAAEPQDNLITNVQEEQVVSHNRYVNICNISQNSFCFCWLFIWCIFILHVYSCIHKHYKSDTIGWTPTHYNR